MLKEKISSDYIKAFKEKDALRKSLLSTLKGEIQTIEKNQVVDSLSDEEVTKVLNKFAKNLRENIKLAGDEKSKMELEVVESYLPKNMSVAEIQSKIDSLVASGIKNMGQLMKEFSTLPADKKVVSDMVKKSLS